ncbi:hypothetical protein [Sporosarcina sp. D27]|uniref:hypothetical protein n=1 Tax=Sporosarcina sp. D27 TaxID=1382305 RepID=UPI000472EAD5|nr:hypothetical protein [Sporosarcina sp. D27]
MKMTKDNVVSWKWIIAALPIILFSFSNRHFIRFMEKKHQITANVWDFALNPLNDPYLMVYYVFPLMVFLSSIYINRTFDYTKLIRLGSYKNWIVTKAKQLILLDLYFIGLFLGAIIITAINTPFSMAWSDIGRINESGNVILYTLQSHFSTPFVALSIQIGLFLITLITVQLIMCVLYAIDKKQSVLHGLNILLFVFGIAGFKIIPDSLALLKAPNYLLSFHGVKSFNSIAPSFIIMIMMLTITLIIVNNIDRNRSSMKQFFTANSPLIAYMLLCLLGICFNIKKYVNEDLPIWNLLIVTFTGTTNEIYSLLAFAYYVVVYIGFIYFVQLSLQRCLSEMSYFTIIRYRSMNRWFLSWFPKIIKSIIVLLFSLMAVTLLIAGIKGYTFDLKQNWIQIIYHFMMNGFLQLLFYVLFVIIVSIFTKDVLKSFISLLILTIFMLPGFRLNNLVPIGLNSMGYLLENTEIFFITFKLIAYIVIEAIVLIYLLNKKDYTF